MGASAQPVYLEGRQQLWRLLPGPDVVHEEVTKDEFERIVGEEVEEIDDFLLKYGWYAMAKRNGLLEGRKFRYIPTQREKEAYDKHWADR